jgi:hypothetical protein
VDERAIRDHVQAINECNQRGGRMLSLVDLLDAQSVDLPLAAYLAAAAQAGASFLVGARPGGAGKTAVMCALANFLPADTAIRAVDGHAVLAEAQRDARPGEVCYLAHEVGRGSYYAYVWGREARAFFRLAARGHTIATNLHADTLDETQDQLCREIGVEPAHLAAVRLKVYLRTERMAGWAMRRWIDSVYESDGSQDRLLWSKGGDATFTRQGPSEIVSPAQEESCAAFLAALLRQGTRRIEDVRRALLQSRYGRN